MRDKQIVFILLPVDNYDRIDDAEKMEGKNFMNLRDLDSAFPNEDVLIYTSESNFMWDCNNQDINFENYWLTYVYLT